MSAYFQHYQKTFFRERLRQDIIHTGMVVRHYLIWFRVARHGNNGCHMVELTDKVRRRHAV
jgi:hypothetical protein